MATITGTGAAAAAATAVSCRMAAPTAATTSVGKWRGRRATAVAVKAAAMASSAATRAATAAVAAAAAAVVLASGGGAAMAAEVLMGSNGGELVFLPSDFSVASGEAIVFKNNAGFPHNVIFDEEEVPAGVDPASISMAEDDLLNAPGETYTVTLSTKGTYRFYCGPHQGVGMYGKVTVN